MKLGQGFFNEPNYHRGNIKKYEKIWVFLHLLNFYLRIIFYTQLITNIKRKLLMAAATPEIAESVFIKYPDNSSEIFPPEIKEGLELAIRTVENILMENASNRGTNVESIRIFSRLSDDLFRFLEYQASVPSHQRRLSRSQTFFPGSSIRLTRRTKRADSSTDLRELETSESEDSPELFEYSNRPRVLETLERFRLQFERHVPNIEKLRKIFGAEHYTIADSNRSERGITHSAILTLLHELEDNGEETNPLYRACTRVHVFLNNFLQKVFRNMSGQTGFDFYTPRRAETDKIQFELLSDNVRSSLNTLIGLLNNDDSAFKKETLNNALTAFIAFKERVEKTISDTTAESSSSDESLDSRNVEVIVDKTHNLSRRLNGKSTVIAVQKESSCWCMSVCNWFFKNVVNAHKQGVYEYDHVSEGYAYKPKKQIVHNKKIKVMSPDQISVGSTFSRSMGSFLGSLEEKGYGATGTTDTGQPKTPDSESSDHSSQDSYHSIIKDGPEI